MLEHDKQDFTVTTPRHTLARFIAHYELFRMVRDELGVIVDIGVGRGGSTWAFGSMCETFFSGNPLKAVYGFDTFDGFPAVSPEDGKHKLVTPGGMKLVPPFGTASPMSRVHLIKGDIAQTVPAFVEARPELQIALLNLDADLYAPTKVVLEYLEPLVVKGGVIVLDEYDLTNVFPGERLAVDQYYERKTGHKPYVFRFPWCTNPSGYIVKGLE
jgi:hypothetical protein